MGAIESKLAAMGLRLPPVTPYPSPNRIHCVQAGSILYLGGHSTARHPLALGGKNTGKVGTEVTEQEAQHAARSVALHMLASIKAHTGDLDKVKRVVKVLGMVNAAPEFEDHPKVINGCSDLFVQVLGDKGKHARSAVGMGSLPMGIPVEIEVIVEVE